MPSPWSDVDEASSSSDAVSEEEEVSSLDDEAQEAVPVDDKRSDGDVEDNTDDEVFEDAGAIEDTDAEDDGSDGGVDYDDEDEFSLNDLSRTLLSKSIGLFSCSIHLFRAMIGGPASCGLDGLDDFGEQRAGCSG